MALTGTIAAVAGTAVSAGSAIANDVGGGGGGNVGGSSGSSAVPSATTESLGQGLTGILSGGLAAGLGISGLAGGNLDQLQAGAAAANPFGGQASQYYGSLLSLLGGGQQARNDSNMEQEFNLLTSISGQQNIGTNTGALSSMGNISTPTQTGALANQAANPLSSVQLPSSMQTILGQNPYSMTSGEQFQYQTGLNTLNAQMAAQGLVGSGAQMTALQTYGQNEASQATQQNITNLLNTQSLANTMGQNQFGNNTSLAQLLSGQQQGSFSNQLGTQQLQTNQQQNTAQNLMNLLSGETGIFSQNTTANEGLISGLLTATQASSSSPATAGGILANLGVANQQSAGNLASGLGGLGQGIGNLLGGLGGASGGGYTGDFSTSGGTTTSGGYNATLYGPSSVGGSYNYGGSNSYGFTE